ncbi:MAG: MotA/TolQ/ExbB proton channel family protein [Elusimicrobiota bacterium]|jgi:biopolymer transport protein ExbB|nr:MotA/TolQ/ExbB proton channel family protein [Elusimicrobiota bacterium]
MYKKKFFELFIFIFILITFCFAEQQSLAKINYVYLLRTSFVMMGLLALSIVCVAFVVERLIYFKKISYNVSKYMKEIEELVKDNDFDTILKISKNKKNPITNKVNMFIENKDISRIEIEELYEIVRAKEKNNMEKFMVILGAGSTVAPLLGLLGTVTGIMSAFASLAASGSGGPSVIAAGVAEALVTTAFGLIIGIPVLIIYNIISDKIKTYLNEMDMAFGMLLFLLKKKD